MLIHVANALVRLGAHVVSLVFVVIRLTHPECVGCEEVVIVIVPGYVEYIHGNENFYGKRPRGLNGKTGLRLVTLFVSYKATVKLFYQQ